MNYLIPIQFPVSIEVNNDTYNNYFGRFEIGPLEPGFAVTIGNTLRRVLLSAIQGAAVKYVKIEGLHHELCPIPGTKLDYIDLILKLKQLVLKTESLNDFNLVVEHKGKGIIKASDIKIPAELSIVNKDLELIEIVEDIDFKMELWVGVGRGYISADEQDTADLTIGMIPVDSIYSPITKVNYYTSKQRVGEKIDYDRLILDINTNGSIEPKQALFISAKYLKDLYQKFIGFDEEPSYLKETKLDPHLDEMDKILSLPVSELELSVRSANCLEAAEIGTLGDLVEKEEIEMLKFRNFGKKSLEEIRELLTKFNLTLGMDIASIREEIENAKKKMV